MKISQLIKELQTLQTELGDLDVSDDAENTINSVYEQDGYAVISTNEP